jgi:hypothetical protein
MHLLLDCMQSSDGAVCLAAVLAAHDLVLAFGDAVLPHFHNSADSAHCMLVQLLIKAAGAGQGGGVAAAADALLR